MKKTSKTVVFFGNERLATGVTTQAPTLTGLLEQNYTVAALVINQDATTSRKKEPLKVVEVASSHGVPILSPAKPTDIIEQLASYQADIGVLVAYGKIIPQAIIDLFPHGIINIHTYSLPKHRGSTTIESTILAGETETGVSCMQLAKQMDTGPVFDYTPMALHGDETKQQLADRLLALGSERLLAVLPSILDGSLKAVPQTGDASYDALITKQDGQLDWSKSATQLSREIKAYAGWPGSRTKLGTKEVLVLDAHVVQDSPATPGTVHMDKHTLRIACAEDWLEIVSLKPEGKQKMPIQAFLAGNRHLITSEY